MTPKTAALLADTHPKTHIVYPHSISRQIMPAVVRFTGERIGRGESVVLMVTAERRAEINDDLSPGEE